MCVCVCVCVCVARIVPRRKSAERHPAFPPFRCPARVRPGAWSLPSNAYNIPPRKRGRNSFFRALRRRPHQLPSPARRHVVRRAVREPAGLSQRRLGRLAPASEDQGRQPAGPSRPPPTSAPEPPSCPCVRLSPQQSRRLRPSRCVRAAFNNATASTWRLLATAMCSTINSCASSTPRAGFAPKTTKPSAA